MKKGIIFDLDQTLVDSSIADSYRKSRNWNTVYSLIPSFILYKGFEDVFKYIIQNGIKVCIVSNSPKSYLQRVISEFRIPCDYIIDYFSVKPDIKPSPIPMIKALSLLGYNNSEAISFGDRDIDIISSNKANITSVACLWGINKSESQSLINSNPSVIIEEAIKIIDCLS